MFLKYSKFPVALSLWASFFLFGCGEKAATSAASTEITIPDGPAEAIQVIAQQMGEGNAGIIWKAMPASYQTDINTVAQLAASKIDSEIYDGAFDFVGRLATVIEKQAEFIAGNPFVQKSPEDSEKITKGMPVLASALKLVASSDIATLSGLQSFDGQEFFDTTVAAGMEMFENYMGVLDGEVATSPLEELRNATVTVVEQEGDEAKLRLSVQGETEEPTEFTKVEGRWVPSAMASEWATSIEKIKANLGAITPEQITQQKPQIMGVLTMLEGVLNQMEAAETQEQFDQALQGAMMPIMGLMMMGGQGGGMGAPMPPAPGLEMPPQ